MNAVDPDFTIRRGQGLYENEISNIFHLATLAPKDRALNYRERAALIREEKERIAYRVEQIMLENSGGAAAYQAGWNAALEAVFREIFSVGYY